MKIQAAASPGANAAPLPYQRGIPEQRLFYREDVKPRHIATYVSAFKHQHLQLAVSNFVRVRHRDVIAAAVRDVQRKI